MQRSFVLLFISVFLFFVILSTIVIDALCGFFANGLMLSCSFLFCYVFFFVMPLRVVLFVGLLSKVLMFSCSILSVFFLVIVSTIIGGAFCGFVVNVQLRAQKLRDYRSISKKHQFFLGQPCIALVRQVQARMPRLRHDGVVAFLFPVFLKENFI